MSPFARCLALCLAILIGCAAAPNPGFAQASAASVPVTRPPRTAGLWAAVGIGAGLLAGSLVLGGLAIEANRHRVVRCLSNNEEGRNCGQSAADRAHDRTYWRYLGSSLGLGVVGLAVGVWGIVGLRKQRRTQRMHALLDQVDLSLAPREAQLGWRTCF